MLFIFTFAHDLFLLKRFFDNASDGKRMKEKRKIERVGAKVGATVP